MGVFLSLVGLLLNARAYDVRSDSKFYDCLMKKPLAVAMFYGEDKACSKKSPFREKYNRLEKMFSTIGKQGYYLKGGVVFIKAHAKYDSVYELIRSFSIPSLPAFMLFKNGVDLRTEDGKSVMLTGWPTFDQLEDFIRDHLETDIDRNIRKRARELAKLREAERWSYLWYRPWLCGAWPYYGCGPGWGWGGCAPGCGWGWGGCGPCRPSWGCGIGFGFGGACGRCW